MKLKKEANMVDLDQTNTPPKDLKASDKICPLCTGAKSPFTRICFNCMKKKAIIKKKRFR